MLVRIFVYGTLKEGFPNHRHNVGRRVGGTFRTCLRFPFYVVRLPNEDRAPWLVNSPGQGHQVLGQVFEVDEDALQAMDDFEEVGRPTGYVRVEVALQALHGPAAALSAWAYMKPQQQLGDCLALEGPFAEYTAELALGYRLRVAG